MVSDALPDVRDRSPRWREWARLLWPTTFVWGHLVLVLSCPAHAEPLATGLRERIESASVIRTFNTENATVRQAATAGDRVAFVLHKKDSSVVVVYDTDGKRHFRIAMRDSVDRQIQGISLSDDGRTAVIRQLTRIEWYTTYVLDEKGQELFRRFAPSTLLSSPSGMFFCMLTSWTSKIPLEIYDRAGQSVGRILPPLEEAWECQFIDDTRLIVADRDSLRLVDTRNAAPVWVIPTQLGIEIGCPGLAVSHRHETVIVHGAHRARAFGTKDGTLRWERAFEEDLNGVVIDDANAQVALMGKDYEEKRAFIEVASLASGEAIGPLIPLSSEDAVDFGGSRYLSFEDGLLTVLGPTKTSLQILPSRAEAWTLFLRTDGAQGQNRDRVRVDGFHIAMPAVGAEGRFLRLRATGVADLLAVIW